MITSNLILLFGVALIIGLASGQTPARSCVSLPDPKYSEILWKDMQKNCTGEVRKQIATEIGASNKYLQLGAYFSRETINRGGFANFFFESAREERQHASKLISYLLMRGRFDDKEADDMTDLFKFSSDHLLKINPENLPVGLWALREALKMEKGVTDSIKKLIASCEKDNDSQVNDYHLVDYLTSDFLTEQYEGQRQLAGYIATLSKLMGQNKEIGEFLFDKQLLK